jgi:hypothetical protein
MSQARQHLEETDRLLAESKVVHREVELNLIPLHAAALLTPLPLRR